MNLRRCAAFGAFLALAAAGCEKTPAEKVQEERAEAVDATQDAREERAEANIAETNARLNDAGQGGPSLGDPHLVVPKVDEAAPPPSAAGVPVDSGGPSKFPTEGDPQPNQDPAPSR